jgi:hypothetical protein
MNEIRFPRWLAGMGVLGGVAIALGFPYIILTLGGDLSEGVKVVLIILGLLGGGILALASAVVGITIPTAVVGGAIQLDRTCCAPESEPNSKAEEE